MWGDDLHAAQQTARRGRDLLVLGVAELGGVCRQSIGVDAAADRETLGFAGKQRAVAAVWVTWMVTTRPEADSK